MASILISFSCVGISFLNSEDWKIDTISNQKVGLILTALFVFFRPQNILSNLKKWMVYFTQSGPDFSVSMQSPKHGVNVEPFLWNE